MAIASILLRADGQPARWARSAAPVAYLEAVAIMEARAAAIAAGDDAELIWLLEHPALYTAGVSAKAEDLLQPGRLPVFASGRGGRMTYHGPGQRVAYVMLDLKARGADVRAFVAGLEAWIIAALARLGVRGERRAGLIGVWAADPAARGRQAKIAAIGVKVRRFVSFHGISLNVAPDLAHFAGIVPCGLREEAVTSLAALGLAVGHNEVDEALEAAFGEVFGPVEWASPPELLSPARAQG